MAKIHYIDGGHVLCNAEPFGPKPGDFVTFWGDTPGDEYELEFPQKPLPVTTEYKKVTCKNCIRLISKNK